MTLTSGERTDARETAGPQRAARGPAPAQVGLPARAAGPDALAASLATADGATRARVLRSLQQTHGNRSVQMIARAVTFDDCSGSQEARILKAHKRGKWMLKRAMRRTRDYDGTDPAAVHTALAKHFNSTSTTVAWMVANNIESLISEMDWSLDPQYECQSKQDGTTLAWVPWCIWGADIEIYPRWFTKGGEERELDDQASTLIHEWFHKYGCKLDVGYEHEDDYSEHSTFRQLLNADSFAEYIDDVT